MVCSRPTDADTDEENENNDGNNQNSQGIAQFHDQICAFQRKTNHENAKEKGPDHIRNTKGLFQNNSGTGNHAGGYEENLDHGENIFKYAQYLPYSRIFVNHIGLFTIIFRFINPVEFKGQPAPDKGQDTDEKRSPDDACRTGFQIIGNGLCPCSKPRPYVTTEHECRNG